ncbi:predicted protein [Nematostella vectensis]|uniref:BTB domain-containing protein n=1 Tax=Nematostella vectensis TaxID=45351 RepID=A7RXL4_NEMVE|nr:predicted protein [Nematostella vectensis]|eukprot:XP_001635857.1 predicted protein [Nematostella vectensis]
MTESVFCRSKAFREKEKCAREILRAKNEHELIGDLARLFEEKSFCDVTFVVNDQEFPAHLSILRTRVPRFCQRFVPHLLSPNAVQSCICIQQLNQDEFSAFLRSVYLDNNVSDYNPDEYPWQDKAVWIFPCNKTPGKTDHPLDVTDAIHDSIEESIFINTDINQSSSESDLPDSDEKMKTSSANEHTENDDDVILENGVGHDDSNIQLSENEGKENIGLKACCKLGSDLLSLRDDSLSSDITFVIENSSNIKAHRAILCARSNYFSAMLYGGWSEGQGSKIVLHGVDPLAFKTVLNFLYGGITHIDSMTTSLCDLLQLSDMYCLEGLKNVIQAQLRIEKCHLFHKPCLDCSVGVMETVEIAHIFNFIELKQTCIRWITKYFDRVMGLKSFAAINKQLQDEILAELQGSLTIMICIDHLKRVDRLKFNTPHIKWAEPVHIVLTAFMDSCLTFIAQNFPVISQREEFLDMLQGVGWSAPLLDEIFAALGTKLSIENCCEMYRAANKLRVSLIQDSQPNEQSQKDESECTTFGYVQYADQLYSRCKEFITSNLHRVSRTESWANLSPEMQSELQQSQDNLMFFEVGAIDRSKEALNSSSKPQTTRGLNRTGQPVGPASASRVHDRPGAAVRAPSSTSRAHNQSGATARPSSSTSSTSRAHNQSGATARPSSSTSRAHNQSGATARPSSSTSRAHNQSGATARPSSSTSRAHNQSGLQLGHLVQPQGPIISQGLQLGHLVHFIYFKGTKSLRGYS